LQAVEIRSAKVYYCANLVFQLAWNLAEEFRLSQPIQVN
jgi:hypothetical protein